MPIPSQFELKDVHSQLSEFVYAQEHELGMLQIPPAVYALVLLLRWTLSCQSKERGVTILWEANEGDRTVLLYDRDPHRHDRGLIAKLHLSHDNFVEQVTRYQYGFPGNPVEGRWGCMDLLRAFLQPYGGESIGARTFGNQMDNQLMVLHGPEGVLVVELSSQFNARGQLRSLEIVK